MPDRDKVKIAAVQIAPRLMETRSNLDRMLAMAREAAAERADLIVFPECSLAGYVFSNRRELGSFAETIPGPSSEELASLCQELDIFVVFGLWEKEGERLFNASVLVGPQGLIASYRKNHLPFLGGDRFVDIGDRPFQVYQTPIGNIGLQICYDIAFPEGSRVLTLLGADILVLSTNFPQGRGEKYRRVICARSFENRVHVVSANRVGSERGYLFAGLSVIADATGEILSQASSDSEEIIYGEVSLNSARQKHQVFIPGQWELNCLADRRPELYGLIAKPNPHTK